MENNMKFRESPTKYINWQIPKFFDLPTEHGYVLRSSPFPLFGEKEKWFLEILPNDTTDSRGLFIILRLVRDATADEHFVAFKMGITYADGKEFKSSYRNEIFSKDKNWWGIVLIDRCTLMDSIDALAPDGTLTVYCTAAIVDKPGPFPSMVAETWITVTNVTPFSQTSSSVTTVETASQTTASESGTNTLIENLKDLYFSKRCADVKIIVKNREFLAHSNILASRSKVFSSMFNNDMVEKNSGTVEITDCDPTSFEDVLIFIYTGNLEVVSSRNAKSLFETAEKYDLKNLKEECVRCMINKLTVDSFCDVLYIGLMYNEIDVLMSVTNFFIENAKDILLTTKWKIFMEENTSLANELILKFVEKHTKK